MQRKLIERVRQSGYAKRRYAELRELGKCTCCKVTDSVETAWCSSCRAEKKLDAKLRYDSRKEAGICPICMSPPEEGFVQCEACRVSKRRGKKVHEWELAR